MRKALVVIALLCTFALVAGGMPAAHGVSGRDFGAAVSGLAKTYPGAIAEHVTGCVMVGGLPAAHGVDGRTFGGLVSGLAKTDPAALVAHILGC